MSKGHRDTLAARLLVCDDETSVAQLIGQVAAGLGYEVQAVTNARSLLDLLEIWSPTVVVLDLLLPETDGVAIIRLLAQRSYHSRLILVSGIGGRVLESARRTAEAYGFTDVAVLPKPFRLEELRKLLEMPLSETVPSGGAADGPDLSSSPISIDALRAAIDRGQIYLAYQPKVECRSGQVVGFEALARLQTEEGGEILPAYFIPLAEKTGLIDPLTRLVCEQGVRWLASSFPDGPLNLAINLAALSLSSPSLMEFLVACCQRYGLLAQRVILELTEGGAVSDNPEILAQLTRTRMQGFQLSIDDFGTGYSSMLELVRLPFTELKIDQVFVRSLESSRESQAVVRSAVDLAHSMGLSIVAEGVEDARLMECVRESGCHYAQGYYIARPMSGQDAVRWTRKQSTRNCPADDEGLDR